VLVQPRTHGANEPAGVAASNKATDDAAEIAIVRCELGEAAYGQRFIES